jgi:hypothetical protein
MCKQSQGLGITVSRHTPLHDSWSTTMWGDIDDIIYNGMRKMKICRYWRGRAICMCSRCEESAMNPIMNGTSWRGSPIFGKLRDYCTVNKKFCVKLWYHTDRIENDASNSCSLPRKRVCRVVEYTDLPTESLLILHRLHRKRRVQQVFCCCMCSLPRNVYNEPLPRNYTRGYTYRLMEGIY